MIHGNTRFTVFSGNSQRGKYVARGGKPACFPARAVKADERTRNGTREKLFKRNSSGLSLTDEGRLLKKRAGDILDMVDKTADEFKSLDDISGGEARIGCAESYQVKYLARAIQKFKKRYPMFRYHLTSGNTEQGKTRLRLRIKSNLTILTDWSLYAPRRG